VALVATPLKRKPKNRKQGDEDEIDAVYIYWYYNMSEGDSGYLCLQSKIICQRWIVICRN
jgi:hypothetical protein